MTDTPNLAALTSSDLLSMYAQILSQLISRGETQHVDALCPSSDQ